MASYAAKAPGVYVEEVASGAGPIAGVGTSTAGFIGVVPDATTMPTNAATDTAYTRAALNTAQLVTSTADFERKFGSADNFVLSSAVTGFFQNGGTRAWVTGLSATSTDLVADATAALAEFETIDEIAIVAAPLDAVNDQINEAILVHCELMQDRFAVLSGAQTSDATYSASSVTAARASEYGAVYYPWVDVSGSGEYVQPVGHVAGLYARVDAERGVHKAPANEVLRGVFGVSQRLGRNQQGPLNQAGVNVIRVFGNSVTVWGARSLAGDTSAFKYVSTRRLFNYLKESIEEGLGWAVFEPNDAALWAKIGGRVSAFLERTWAAGALFGATPEDAFYVKCDADTNPEDVRAMGMVVTEIGVAITQPAEFVVFKLAQKTNT
ncbi:MAG: phage tail sheath family protein [Alphaproteobacteria bacterium]|nr:phage tail sheath family protein [Alphaproteobacteria bacterium]